MVQANGQECIIIPIKQTQIVGSLNNLSTQCIANVSYAISPFFSCLYHDIYTCFANSLSLNYLVAAIKYIV